MKEYFAEIEALKSQLSMTREKNGVYVDPSVRIHRLYKYTLILVLMIYFRVD